MALRNDEKKEDVAIEQQRRKRTLKKQQQLASMEVPATSTSTPAAATMRSSKKAGRQERRASTSGKKGSLLDAVSAIMGPGKNKNRDNNSRPPKKKQPKEPISNTNNNHEAAKLNRPIMDDSQGADQLSQPRKVKKAPRQKPTTTVDSPPVRQIVTSAPLSKAKAPKTVPQQITISAAPDADASTVSFLESLEEANETRKMQEQQQEFFCPPFDDINKNNHHHNNAPIKKNKKKPKLSAARQRDLQNELAKRRAQNKQKRRKQLAALEDFVIDDDVPDVGWFSMIVKEPSSSDLNYKAEHDDENTKNNSHKKKKKTRKQQLRTTVDYSRHDYKFLTKRDIEDAPPGYYLEMISIKKRQFHIQNLFTSRPLVPRVYKFHVDTLVTILDKKDDKWWIKSRLPHYIQDEDDENADEKGMEALAIFFGPNDIDNDPENKDDTVDMFSIVSVESVHFSDDDDENERERCFHGTPRETVEVMPGEFTILRKEEETHEAIREGTYIESLCLGCGKALLSVQDALQVACPSCGSITPLNGICLHKPFGIATGIAAAKVKDQLTPRKSVFKRAAQLEDDAQQKSAPTRKVATAVSTRWITGPEAKKTAPATQRKSAPPVPAPARRKLTPEEASARRRQKEQQKNRTASRPKPAPPKGKTGKTRTTKPATKPGAVSVAAR